MTMHPALKNHQLTYAYRLFYALKPLVPRPLQLVLRRRLIRRQQRKYAHVWPIDLRAANPPAGWRGWPDDKQFALVLNHDVDTQAGHDKCRLLMDLEEELGLRSTFYIVPERYRVDESLLAEIKARGFGLGVHGLTHDGKLFDSWEIFAQRARRINHYLAKWDTRCFSSPSMHSNLAWMHALKIDCSTSTFDTDPFEPQRSDSRTIFPLVVRNPHEDHDYVELSYTLPQDFTLFVLMRQPTSAVWQTKLAWIAKHGGMALVNTHPDYMNFTDKKNGSEAYQVRIYKNFLLWIDQRYQGRYWPALSREVAHYVRRQGLQPVLGGSGSCERSRS